MPMDTLTREFAAPTAHLPTPDAIARLDDRAVRRDLGVLRLFVGRYCAITHHGERRQPFALELWGREVFAHDAPLELCESCARLLTHGVTKRVLCPQDPKPMCKHCPEPCYAGGYRARIRQVMRVAGWDLIAHGRIDLLWHYLF